MLWILQMWFFPICFGFGSYILSIHFKYRWTPLAQHFGILGTNMNWHCIPEWSTWPSAESKSHRFLCCPMCLASCLKGFSVVLFTNHNIERLYTTLSRQRPQIVSYHNPHLGCITPTGSTERSHARLPVQKTREEQKCHLKGMRKKQGQARTGEDRMRGENKNSISESLQEMTSLLQLLLPSLLRSQSDVPKTLKRKGESLVTEDCFLIT